VAGRRRGTTTTARGINGLQVDGANAKAARCGTGECRTPRRLQIHVQCVDESCLLDHQASGPASRRPVHRSRRHRRTASPFHAEGGSRHGDDPGLELRG